MSVRLVISSCGPLVSVQDAGRKGYMRFGVTHSGPMDRGVFATLGSALENTNNSLAIEVPAVGTFSIKCLEGSVTAAFFSGGYAEVSLDSERLSPWSVFTFEPGSSLVVKPGISGSWGYLGFNGAIRTERWLGSQSNLLNSGLCGRPLVPRDEIIVNGARVSSRLNVNLPLPSLMRFNGVARAVLGPQDRFFSKEAISNFENCTYSISREFDRMGMRLFGEKLDIKEELTMPSEAVLRGAVQVPGHGHPVILLADHQTTGGYPKIATVVSADIDRICQLRANESLRFQFVTVNEGIELYREYQYALHTYVSRIPEFRQCSKNKARR